MDTDTNETVGWFEAHLKALRNRPKIETKAEALAYLRSLPAEHVVQLPGRHESPAAGQWDACRAVEVASDLASAYEFAACARRWHWTAGELVAWLDIPKEPWDESPVEEVAQ